MFIVKSDFLVMCVGSEVVEVVQTDITLLPDPKKYIILFNINLQKKKKRKKNPLQT